MTDRNHTFASRFCLREASLAKRIERDLRLALYLLGTINSWAKARKLRREFQRCRESGEPFYVDRFNTAEPPR